jgi:hypothetical protein
MHDSADIPSVEPREIRAGDTIQWTKDLTPHYPADEGWTLTYKLINSAGNFSATAIADTVPTQFLVTLAAAVTALYTVGHYSLIGQASKAGVVHTIYKADLDVLPNLAAATTYEIRTDARIAYDNAVALWKAVKTYQSYSVGGKTYTLKDLDALKKYKDDCKAELDAEEAEDSGISRRRTTVRFVRP